MAIIGVLVSVALVIACGGLAYYVVSQSSRPTHSRIGALVPISLRVGDCIEAPTDLALPVNSVTVLPCSQLHNAQVFTTIKAAHSPYPGVDAASSAGLAACNARVHTFLGTSNTALHVLVFVPNEATWDAGKYTQVCLLVDRQNDITGDIRQYV